MPHTGTHTHKRNRCRHVPKSAYNRKIFMLIFIATILIMLLYSDKMDIQQEVEEKKKTWSIYRMKFYSVRKQNEIVNRKKKKGSYWRSLC